MVHGIAYNHYLCAMQTERSSFSVIGFLQLTRFWNLVIVALAQYFTAVFLIDASLILDYRLFLLSLSTVLIAGAGYIINDYYDIKIDLINKPERVVIGRSIARRYAIMFHSILSFLGVVIGFYLEWQIGIINFLSAFLLWWYSNYLKRQPFIGNFTVAILTGMSIYLINVLYTYHPLVTIYSLFAFFMTIIREIVKDMEDLKGDNTFGCRTLPIIWGIRQTKILVYVLLLCFCFIVIAMKLFYTQLPHYFFLVTLFAPLAFFMIRLIRADTKKDFYQLSQWCKFIMLLGITSMIFI